MNIPFINLKRLEPEFLDHWSTVANRISSQVNFIGGEEVVKFEENLKNHCQTQHAIGCANGTDALQLALRACGVGKNDLVFLPDFTFWGTFEAVVNVGALPVTIDISRDDLQMDFTSFSKAALTLKPKAAILVHLFGTCSLALWQYRSFCKQHNILLIEDGAQSFATQIEIDSKETPLSSFEQDKKVSIFHDALIGTLSFYPAKVLGAAGDAGAIVTNNDTLAKHVRQLGNHGRSSHYSYDYSGWNSRIDALQAAYLNCCFLYIEQRIASRRQSFSKYIQMFQKLKIAHLQIGPGILHNGYLNAILIEKDRNQLQDYLKKRQIGTAIIYPETISEQRGAQPYLAKSIGGQISKTISQQIISLPLFAYMKENELSYIEENLTLAL